MTDYTKITNFATKDSLPLGNPAKIVKGTEINTEFDNIATAVATKANKASPAFTGTMSLAGTNLTATFAELNILDGVTAILDEDNMASDSATALATQQSIKAYVDANAGGSLATTLTTGNSTGGTDIVVTAGDSITTDTIAETTAASGVTVDGLLIKDSSVFLGGSSSANQLDDYEEGTFTFIVEDTSDNAITNDTSTGYYTKVGELVFVSMDINAAGLGSASGAIRIDGLPFTCSGTKQGSVAIAGESTSLNITGGYTIVGDFVEFAPRMNLFIWDSATGTTALTAAELSSNGELKISGSYFAA